VTDHTDREQQFVDLVNPLQGTDSDFSFSRGNCLPLVTLPFGMTAWTPQADEGPWMFDSRTRKLQGIRATHQPSPWIGDYGHFTVMPMTGSWSVDARSRASVFDRDETIVQPHYFKTVLGRYHTTVELTPTTRCAIMRFTFPVAQRAGVLLQPFPGDTQMEVYPERSLIVGRTRANSGGTPANFACYIAATISRPLTTWTLIDGATPWEDEPRRVGDRVAVYLPVDTSMNQVVELRIATSFISADQAVRNLDREIANHSFEEVRAEAGRVWNEALGRARVTGGTDQQRRTFYTCLYRALLFPRIWYEHDARDRTIHYSPYDGAVHEGVMYADNGFWDTFRTLYPLLALIYPDRLAEMLQGWVQAAKEGGWFPKWASPGYRACMIGTHLDAVIADAYAKGVTDFDADAAYAAMRRDAMEPGDRAGNYGRLGLHHYHNHGYVPADQVPHAAARTQEYAYNDFCVAQMADMLGHTRDARILWKRALNYRSVFDPTVGFMRGRNADGSWLEPFDEFTWDTRAYIEGSAWQYSWAVPHDPAGLIDLMGGPVAFVAKLDRMLGSPATFHVGQYGFEIHEMTEMATARFGQYAHSNQPVHHVLYLYACAGQPWKTQYWVRRVLNELYSPEADGLPGDEDNGEMSAWYIWSALGLYPLCPGDPAYVLGSPLFPEVLLRLPSGRRIVIEAADNSPDHMYVERVWWKGAPRTETWITHDNLIRGGTLRFQMSTTPSTTRVVAPEDLPFSLSRMTDPASGR
jgi:predicted alpha-1,2-mannosidase